MTSFLFWGVGFYIVYRQSLLGPVDPSFRALSGRLKFTVRRHKSNQYYLPLGVGVEGVRCQDQWRVGCVEVVRIESVLRVLRLSGSRVCCCQDQECVGWVEVVRLSPDARHRD